MSVVIVVPVYKLEPSQTELLCLMRLRQFCFDNVVLAGPDALDVTAYLKWWPRLTVERFADRYFSGIPGYNELMLRKEFYERFLPYGSTMLLHQLDAILLDDTIGEFAEMPYDYFGAPWKGGQLAFPGVKHPKLLRLFGKRVFVGNGGLSLRKLPSTIDLLHRRRRSAEHWKQNEDAFFAYWGIVDGSFESCPITVASRFALETDPEYWIRENGRPGMGVHGFDKVSSTFYDSLLAPEFAGIGAYMAELSPSA